MTNARRLVDGGAASDGSTFDPTASRSREPLLTRRFVILLGCGFANFLAMGTVAPLLPRFVKDSLHGSNFLIGAMVAIYAISAVLVRPSAASIANTRGRRRIVIVGALLTGVSFFGYAVADSLGILIPARLLTGAGQALYFTGAATMVSELAPVARRGEALSYFSVAVYLGGGVGPALGEAIYASATIGWGFVVAGVLGLVSTVVALRLHETLDPTTIDASAPKGSKINRRALAPGGVLALGMIGGVAFGSYMPLFSDELGMNGSQWVYLAYAAVVILVRVFGARLPDVLGPGRSGTIATVAIALGMITIAVFATPWGLYAGAIVFAIGSSFHYPSLMALVINSTPASERSSVIATFTAFFDVASGFGGLSLGVIASAGGYRSAFLTAAVAAIAGLILLRAVVLRPRSTAAIAA